MQQTYAKAYAAAIVTIVGGVILSLTGVMLAPEMQSALETLLLPVVGTVALAAANWFAVWAANNAPAGGVVTVVPAAAVGTTTIDAKPVQVVQDAVTGAVRSVPV